MICKMTKALLPTTNAPNKKEQSVLINGVPTAHDKIDPLSQAERGPNQRVTSIFLVPWIPRVPQNRKEAVSGDMDRPTKVVESSRQSTWVTLPVRILHKSSYGSKMTSSDGVTRRKVKKVV